MLESVRLPSSSNFKGTWRSIFLVLLALLHSGNSENILSSPTEQEAHVADDSTNLKTLELVQIIFRHGDRTPTASYPLDPYKNASKYWPQGLGQLTNVGKLQHYKLGRYFRKRYDGFLSQSYVPHEIFVLSSDMDRTIMSAEANLAGLYKPKSSEHNWNPVIPWTPIPIRTIPSTEDKFLRTTKSCPKYQHLYKQAMSSDVVQQCNQNFKDFIEYVKNHTGIKEAETLEDIVDVEDILTVEKHHHYPLPVWASKIWEPFHEIAAVVFAWSTLTQDMKRLKAGPLLKVLLHNMKIHRRRSMTNESSHTRVKPLHLAASESAQVQNYTFELEDLSKDSFIVGKAKKFYMYSAHDSTLLRIMDTIGVYNVIMPPYTAAFIIELHKVDGEFVVKMFYRNETHRPPYKLKVPECEEDCKLNNLIRLTKPVVPKNWEAECKEMIYEHTKLLGLSAKRPKSDHSKKKFDNNATNYFVLGQVLLFVGIILVLIGLILYLGRDRLIHPVFSRSYPYIKSRTNNYGVGDGYERI